MTRPIEWLTPDRTGKLVAPPASSQSASRASAATRPGGGERLAALVPLLLAFAIALGAALECRQQLLDPERSALAWFHGAGLLLDVPLGYEPGRGVGRILGIVGSVLMVLLLGYSLRKRVAGLRKVGRLSRWLDVHIAFGLAGPALITLHTAGRLGGAISIAYWSMMIVLASGVVGRYLYAQVPRTLGGRERGLEEVRDELQRFSSRELEVGRASGLRAVDRLLRSEGVAKPERRALLRRVRHALHLEHQVAVLERTRRILSLWHRIHVPLVCVLYSIAALHIAVAVLFDPR